MQELVAYGLNLLATEVIEPCLILHVLVLSVTLKDTENDKYKNYSEDKLE